MAIISPPACATPARWTGMRRRAVCRLARPRRHHKGWPELVTPAQDDAIADEMFRVTKGTDMGWPYTYWDGVRKIRLMAPEYGGDGKTPVADSKYAVPVAAFRRCGRRCWTWPFMAAAVPADVSRRRVPGHAWRRRRWRHLAGGHGGYNVVFVPFTGGKAGTPMVFADGFAGASPTPSRSRPRCIGRRAWRWGRTARSMWRIPTRAGSGGFPTAKPGIKGFRAGLPVADGGGSKSGLVSASFAGWPP